MSDAALILCSPLDGKAVGDAGSPLWLAAPVPGHVVQILAAPTANDAATVLASLAERQGASLRPAGPGQWLLVGDRPLEPTGLQAIAAALDGRADVLDQSHGRVRIALGGSAVRTVLAKGTALDLHPHAFPVGASAMTMIGHLAVHLTKVDDDRFEIVVTRSFAESLWEDLEAMAAEYL
ncbi:sarcosine oxidase subunit gamma [Rhizobium sp. TRM95111]|uniref:sarcosine oxidase subunit gamma n=1 Tax=Rhizobium alarense TaxID=2846851 RepID=UPI001F34E387|nr:sarcosine oxidase subunit gamma family protein [Rhizobium alarense]MCF3642533.1 sarcosine oxidase subunit gamma [Rhizobium alarense]